MAGELTRRGRAHSKPAPIRDGLSLLEVARLLDAARAHLIVNRRHLRKHYPRRGIARIPGTRDKRGRLVKPWLRTKPLGKSDYAHLASVDIGHHAARINLLLTQRVQLVRADDNTPITEVGGILLDNLAEYHAYTLVSDGAVLVPELRLKIGSPHAFAALDEAGILELKGKSPRTYDYRVEYTIRLAGRRLMPAIGLRANLDGVFEELARVRVLASLFTCCLRAEPDPYAPAQLEELQRHYLTRNLYVSFPTTVPYRDLREALAEGTIEARLSYRVEIGNHDVLSLEKLRSANEFLARHYEAFDKETGARLEDPPTCEQSLDEGIRFGHKPPSPKLQLTGVDETMLPLYDDYLGIEYNGSVAAVLAKVGADSLRRLLQERRNGGAVGRQELVEALRLANDRLMAHAERLYREQVCPVVFQVGSTGRLPDDWPAQPETAEELEAKYPGLTFSPEERAGTFFEVGATILSVFATTEYYTR